MSEDLVNKDDNIEDLSPYLFGLDKITRPNCKLCTSEHREEVEGWYNQQKRKNYSFLKNKLEEDKNEKISIPAIRNHMLRHHKAVENNLSFNEYSNELSQWIDKQSNKELAIKGRIAILDRELMAIAELSDDLDLEERRKSAETIKKLSEAILLHEKHLKEYQTEAGPVKLIFNQIKVVFTEEIERANDNHARKVLSNVLNKLQTNVGDFVIG